MKVTNRRINVLLQLLLPYVAGIGIAAAGYLYYVKPAFDAYLRSRTEARALEDRLRGVEAVVARGRVVAWPDEAEPMRLFEARVSKDDRVMDVIDRLTKALNESATDGKLRNLAIGTGDEALASSPAGPRKPGALDADVIDARWSLFPYPLKRTAVTISFDCSYATIINFLWRVRDLPTAIEVRAMKLTRGLPLMNVQFTFLVFQRGDALQPLQQTPAAPGMESPSGLPNEPPPLNPFMPKLLQPSSGRSGG